MKVIGMESAEMLMWCFAGGVIIACIYAFYAKGIIGKLIRALIKANAFDEASAVLPESVGCKSFIYRYIMRGGSIQNGAVVCIEGGKCYINSNCKEKMLSKFGKSEASVIQLAIVLVLVIVAVVLIAALYPVISEQFIKTWNS